MATDLHTAANRLLKAWDLNDLIHEHIEALRQALANEALDKMAENARKLGLDYEPSSVSKLAREAGIRDCTCNGTKGCLDRLIELVRADEREACARIAEEPSAANYECTVACGGPAQTFQQRFPKHSHDIAKEIRARGNT
jgi:hypothetical protein